MSASKDTLDRPTAALMLSPSEAIVAVLAAAIAADGIIGIAEARRLEGVLGTMRWVLGLGQDAVAGAARRGVHLLAAHGVPAVLKTSAESIPPDLRATTFALAVDLVLADGRLGSSENAFIEQLQTALRIEGTLASKIVHVLLLKNRASGPPDA
jgi:hypothetical protein